MYHNPVLLTDTVKSVITNPSGIYVDVTFGGGGHSREILRNLAPNGRLFAFDQDSDCPAKLTASSPTSASHRTRLTRPSAASRTASPHRWI